jgi:hypothetical protein
MRSKVKRRGHHGSAFFLLWRALRNAGPKKNNKRLNPLVTGSRLLNFRLSFEQSGMLLIDCTERRA